MSVPLLPGGRLWGGQAAAVPWGLQRGGGGGNDRRQQAECTLGVGDCLPFTMDFSQAPQNVKWSGLQPPTLATPTFRAAVEMGTTRQPSARGKGRAGAWTPRERRSMELGGRMHRCLVVGFRSWAPFWSPQVTGTLFLLTTPPGPVHSPTPQVLPVARTKPPSHH